MSVSASLEATAVSVQPGGETTLTVRVLNSGTLVEEVSFEVIGPCATWSVAEPDTLSLYPGAAGSVRVVLRPPRDSGTAADELPIGVRVVPANDTSAVVIPEGSVTVLPYAEVTAELLPRSSHSAWRGRHKTAVDNRGNTAATIRLTTQGGSERARPVFEPDELYVPPGEARFTNLRIRPAKRMWRGTAITHPFQAVVTPSPVGEGEPHPPVILEGSYEQQAILPRWLPRALILALLAAALLVGLWYSLLRPTVESAAREAITPEAIESAVNDPDQEGETAGGDGPAGAGGEADGAAAGAGDAGAGGGPESADGGPDGTGGAPLPGEPGGPAAPTSARAEIRAGAGGGATTRTVYEVPAGMTFELTDIVVQNPQGDAGDLVISSQDEPLLSLALENFRDTDYHFVTPVAVPGGGEITVSLSCREVGEPVQSPTPSECAQAVFLSGALSSPPGGGD